MIRRKEQEAEYNKQDKHDYKQEQGTWASPTLHTAFWEEEVHDEDRDSDAEHGMDKGHLYAPYPVYVPQTPVGAELSEIFPVRIKEAFEPQTFFDHAKRRAEQQECDPALAPVQHQFTCDNRATTIEYTQKEQRQGIEETVRRRQTSKQYSHKGCDKKEKDTWCGSENANYLLDNL